MRQETVVTKLFFIVLAFALLSGSFPMMSKGKLKRINLIIVRPKQEKK